MRVCCNRKSFDTACDLRGRIYRDAMMDAMADQNDAVACFETHKHSWKDAVAISSKMGLSVLPRYVTMDARKPGDALTIFISRAYGAHPQNCKCNKMRQRMNNWGWKKCVEKHSYIWEHCKREALQQGIELKKRDFSLWLIRAALNHGVQNGKLV